VDLSGYIDKKQTNCLNENSRFTIGSILDGTGRLESDCDEQMILEIVFNQPVKIHSLGFTAEDKSFLLSFSPSLSYNTDRYRSIALERTNQKHSFP